MAQTTNTPDWYDETPIFIEALADTTHSGIVDVCSILDDGMSGNDVSEDVVVHRFIEDFILDEAA